LVKKIYTLVFTDKAIASLQSIYDYIKKDSPQNANMVIETIMNTSETLITHPRIYRTDEYYHPNSKDIRRFIQWSYRIVYEVVEKDNTVVILNIFHTSIAPKKIKG